MITPLVLGHFSALYLGLVACYDGERMWEAGVAVPPLQTHTHTHTHTHSHSPSHSHSTAEHSSQWGSGCVWVFMLLCVYVCVYVNIQSCLSMCILAHIVLTVFACHHTQIGRVF